MTPARLWLAFLAGLPLVGSPAADRVLGEDGRSEYRIVVPRDAGTPALNAALAATARLLQAAFAANRITVPVVAEDQIDPTKPALYLGRTAFAAAHGVQTAALPGWGYVHRVVGRDVILAGHDQPAVPDASGPASRPRYWDRVGTAKAVVDFLRQYAGARFLYPDLAPWTPLAKAGAVKLLDAPAIEFLPTPRIAVPADLDRRVTPPLEHNLGYPSRGGFYDLAGNRFPLVDTTFGTHTYARAVPVEQHRDAHPEYFALVGGQRLREGQYCVANREVQELLFQDLVRCVDQGFRVVDLGQPDGFQACECPACRALFETGDDWSEKLWILHRQLAERLLRARPQATITLMAYVLTETPPRTFREFPANTRVMLCGTNDEDLAKWRGYTVPRGYTAYVYNWCPNLGSRYTPMRTPRYVEAQVRRLARLGIHGLYRDGPGELFGLEGPVYYTMSRMFDDPERLQAKDLVKEFVDAAFGPSAAPMQAFYDRLYHGLELYSGFLGTRSPAWFYQAANGRSRKYVTDPFQLLGFLYPPSHLAALEADLAQAERSADQPRAKARLALVRREFDYLTALARVVHLYHAWELAPGPELRGRLLEAIDARNAQIAGYYDERGRTRPLPGWEVVLFPFAGHSAAHLRLAYNGYQEPYQDTCLNWDTAAKRREP